MVAKWHEAEIFEKEGYGITVRILWKSCEGS
jgi:hypothetical protein